MDIRYLSFIYLSPHGRINRREYTLGFLGLLAVFVVLNELFAELSDFLGAGPGPLESYTETVERDTRIARLNMLWLAVLLYPIFCLNAKRLHDRGKPGWRQLMPLAFMAGISAVAVTVQALFTFSGIPTVLSGIASAGYIMVMFVAFIRGYLLLFWDYAGQKGDADANRFGPASTMPEFIEGSARRERVFRELAVWIGLAGWIWSGFVILSAVYHGFLFSPIYCGNSFTAQGEGGYQW